MSLRLTKLHAIAMADCRLRIAVLVLLSTFNIQHSTAQVSASLKADSTQIQIGDYLHLHLAIKIPKENVKETAKYEVIDTAGNFELISSGHFKTDTFDNYAIVTDEMIVSAYDSGEYSAGPLMILFRNNKVTDTIFTNGIPITVTTFDVDTTKPFKPIKAPLEVKYLWGEFLYYYIFAALVLITVIAWILLIRKFSKIQVQSVRRPRPKDPAHIWARKELKKLDDDKLWQKGDVKLYYSRLTDILRLYLEFRFNWNAMENTTDEIADEISKYDVNDVAKNLLLEVLRGADLVKFAKMIPAENANTKAMSSAADFIEVTKQTEEVPKK